MQHTLKLVRFSQCEQAGIYAHLTWLNRITGLKLNISDHLALGKSLEKTEIVE